MSLGLKSSQGNRQSILKALDSAAKDAEAGTIGANSSIPLKRSSNRMHACRESIVDRALQSTSATCDTHFSALCPPVQRQTFHAILNKCRGMTKLWFWRLDEEVTITPSTPLLFYVSLLSLKFVTDQRSVFIPIKSVLTMALVSASSFSLSFETSSFTSCSSFSSFLLSSSSSALLSLLPFLLLPTAFFFEDFFADGETASFSPSFSCDILALLLFLSSLPSLPDAEEVDGASFFRHANARLISIKSSTLGKVRNLTTVAS